MGDDSGEKTEQPTPNKLKEARKKGQVAKSKDMTTSVLLIISYFSLKSFSGYIWSNLLTISDIAYSQIPLGFTESVAMYLLGDVLRFFLLIIVPLFMVNLLVVLIMEFGQVGFLVSFEPLIPQLNKLNPIEGAKKLVSLKQLIELFKSIIKMFIVGYIIYSVLKDQFQFVLLAQELTPYQVMGITSRMVMDIVIKVGLFYIIIAVLDYFYQRFEFIKSLKMSKKEIKDEYKRLEGDPLIKQRQREAQRQMSMGRQMGAVPDSDVVVTNPIHYAIALKYKPNEMKAPKVLAIGQRLVAKEIVKIAEEHMIPIVENPPLARKLFDSTIVGSDIPQIYYKAVAEILAFVYNIKKKKKNNNASS
ncbi:flagellar biosynthesis protein FlhB [Candidatus Marinamargulisbacteria bacterium SCGC AG-414-C22]|nr:flagellar biosynthesis protein FlhB [Candidatus Marinamargulisbacteria bacterium SCGC AG-414-C22]